MIPIQGQVPLLQPALTVSHRGSLVGEARLPWPPAAMALRDCSLTYALRVTACPGAIDRAVPAEQACGVVAFPTFVDDGAGENQAITEHDSGIAWSPRVPTGDH